MSTFTTAPPDEAWADLNKRAGARIKQLRVAVGMGPTELVSRLREEEHIETWHRMTVARVEDGSRPLRLDEAHALAAIFGIEMHDLLEATEDLDIATLEARQQDAERAINELRQANAERLSEINFHREALARLDREIRQAGALIDRHQAAIINAEQRIADINDGETDEDLADAGNGYTEDIS